MSTIIPRAMTIEEFTPLIGHEFLVDTTPQNVKLRLIEAIPRPNHAALDRLPFLLVFHSPADVYLIDGLYTMKCGALDPAAIGIGSVAPPVGAEPGFYYQAIFN